MKSQLASLTTLTLQENQSAHTQRYQIYRQGRAGNFMLEHKTDSPTDAVELFTIMSPAYEGGEIHIWDTHLQRIGASAQWLGETTAFGFTVQNRRNVFVDHSLAVAARTHAEREAMRVSIVNGLRQSA